MRSRLGERAEWNIEHHLLATISDQLAQYDWNRRAERAKDAKKHTPERVQPIPRPGMSKGSRRHRTTLGPRDIARRLVEQQRRQERRAAAPRT